MSSNTQPLPAAQLMALADAMASAVGSHVICDAGLEGSHMERTLEAYRAARAASPVTLEEHLMTDLYRQDFDYALDDQKDEKWIAACRGLHDHARALAEAQKGKARDE